MYTNYSGSAPGKTGIVPGLARVSVLDCTFAVESRYLLNSYFPSNDHKTKGNLLKRVVYSILVITVLLLVVSCQRSGGPCLATGIKIGKVTQHSAIIWVRLTQHPERVGNDAAMPTIKYRDPQSGELIDRKGRQDMTPVIMYPKGYSENTIQGAVPGRSGEVRVTFKPVQTQQWKQLDWQTVNPQKGYTHQFKLDSLKSGQSYDIRIDE